MSTKKTRCQLRRIARPLLGKLDKKIGGLFLDFTFSRRGMIRLYSFSLILILVLAGGCAYYYNEANRYRTIVENSYRRSIGELSELMTDTANTLTKGLYAGTPGQLSAISAALWRNSGAAKAALSAIETNDLRLESAYRFLSQVGEYTMTLSKKAAAGQAITAEETKSLEEMLAYAETLSQKIYEVEEELRNGTLNLTRAALPEPMQAQEADAPLDAGPLDESLAIEGYGKLIYDGPFSDHMLEITPKMTENAAEISADRALLTAQKASGSAALARTDDENSHMPSYCFEGEGIYAGVTKKGGYLTYLIIDRELGEARLDPKQAVSLAASYLTTLGIEGMKATYYETSNGICTVNFAFAQDGVLCYPDLVKVGVALDNGQIVDVDARSYLVNHHERELPAGDALLLPEEAQKSLGSALAEVTLNGLAVIPTDGANEKLCYEYHAAGRDGHNLLLYVNAETGEEEQILILIETENGVLTV